MANKRIDELTAGVTLGFDSLLEVCIDPAGSKQHQKFTIQQLFDFIVGKFGFASFGTTALLRANTIFADGKIYFRLGDDDINDGLTASYRFDAASLADDDGISVIKPNSIGALDPGRYYQINL